MSTQLLGHAFWAPGFKDLGALEAGAFDPELARPPLAFVPSRMKRATSQATRMAVECAHGVIASTGLDLANTATVFGSLHGEIQIAVDQMVMMEDGEGQISPARFKNSVHNTAAGLFSITAKNRGFTTALAGGAHTFALSLLEGLALLKTRDADALVVVCTDESLPSPIDGFSAHKDCSFALAFGAGEGPKLGLPKRRASDAPLAKVPDYLQAHPAAAAYRLVLGARRGAGLVALDEQWEVELT